MHKRVIAMVSSLTILFTTAILFPDNTSGITGEITANAEVAEQTFTVNGGMNFTLDASNSNWKKYATLESDGYK